MYKIKLSVFSKLLKTIMMNIWSVRKYARKKKLQKKYK